MIVSAAGSGHVLEVTGRLPPLVSFTVHRSASKCVHRYAPCRLSLPSICTQVSASLRKLSLMYPRLSSSDLQCIVGQLPHLEELHCRYTGHGVLCIQSAHILLKSVRNDLELYTNTCVRMYSYIHACTHTHTHSHKQTHRVHFLTTRGNRYFVLFKT